MAKVKSKQRTVIDTPPYVDFFSQEKRDLREDLLDFDSKNMISRDWVRMDADRQRQGKQIVEWPEERSFPQIGDRLALLNLQKVGTVVTYGIKSVGREFYRSVWLKFSDGSFLKLSADDIADISKTELEELEKKNKQFASKLSGATKKIENQKKERRQKQVKGSHLLEVMLAVVGKTYSIDEKASFYKISGKEKGKSVYLLRKGGRVDLSGFDIDHDAVTKISAEEAKDRHIGKVRGQINFSLSDDLVMDAFKKALKEL